MAAVANIAPEVEGVVTAALGQVGAPYLGVDAAEFAFGVGNDTHLRKGTPVLSLRRVVEQGYISIKT